MKETVIPFFSSHSFTIYLPLSLSYRPSTALDHGASPRPVGYGDNEGESESESDYSSDPEIDSDISDGEDESDDEGQLPPEHYLAQAKGLNVSQLRQNRYSDGTLERLDETRMYWDRYCRYIGASPVQHWRWISGPDETVGFLYAFFSWRCTGDYSRHSATTKFLTQSFDRCINRLPN
ncbi:hypothetical protein FE257_003361 [Aspergillus nanangensis]|uniref:Uncharacterized protein n=1 Tax=Aspergillus nanangensis TaxID=2582783 RepID=A0AAD4GPN1_ASPNN|nr:hypothetical protein FE257_003361 [Aspergillus nanangensis]